MMAPEMSQRLSSPVRAGYRDSSSPDPLADPDDYSPTPTTTKSTRMPTTILRQEPQIRARRVTSGAVSSGFVISEHTLSPWKIKVMVEAEGDDEVSASVPRNATTKYMVTLKDADSQSRPVRRKSISKAGNSPSRPRVTRSRRQSVTDLTITPLGDEEDEEEWKNKPKPSHKKQPTTRRKSRQSSGAVDVQVDKDVEEIQNTIDVDVAQNLRDLDINTLNSSQKSSKSAKGKKSQDTTVNVLHETSNAYPTPSPTASSHGMSDPQDDEPIGLDTVMESEGFTMIDLNSLPSARQISGYPTLPAVPEDQHGSDSYIHDPPESVSTTNPTIDVTFDTSQDTNSIISNSSGPTETKKKYRIGHLQLPSSTKVQRNRLVTPMPVMDDPYCSSNLPSSPPAINSTVRERSPIHSDQVVRAGSVLLDALAPDQCHEPEIDKDNTRFNKDLFSGFSHATTRELRAELRFGEELAKKQSQTPLTKDHKDGNETALSVASGRDQITPISHPCDLDPAPSLSLQQRIENDRKKVVQQACSTVPIMIDSDEEDVAEDGEETMGDIWLSEARKTSSSPRDTEHDLKNDNSTQSEKPRRALLPSPWRRGEQSCADQTQTEETLSGLYWQGQDDSSSGGRFGDAIIAQPEEVVASSNIVRQGSHGINIKMQPYNMDSAIRQESNEDAESGPKGHASEDFIWRSAEEAVDEDTALPEAEAEADSDSGQTDGAEDIAHGTTRLYETNLDAIQDVSSSPHISAKAHNTITYPDHDSTYSSISGQSSPDTYSQRVNLSPSKQRPATPRSALKGSRFNYTSAICRGIPNDEPARKVVWARKSKCMNEEWEESTRSIISGQDSSTQSLISTTDPSQQGIEVSFEVQPQKVESTHDKSWFSWFNTKAAGQQQQNEERSDTAATADSALPNVEGANPTYGTKELPSYLMPPSYPSDPRRNPDIMLSTSDQFTNSHFRTLHIIYRKSLKSRFHGPSYPDEVRPEVLELVEKKLKIMVDESETMGEDGIFEYTVGGTEARILERFMREIELPYLQQGKPVNWGWTIEQLAENLARIAIGETVREEEKAVEGIMRSARKLR